MKIVKLNSKPDEKGYYPIPKSMVNWRMFCYPNLGEDDKWETKEKGNKKVNALVCYYGELYGDKKWSIGAMGYDHMLIWNPDNKEVNCYFADFIYDGGHFIYIIKDENDWHIYDKNRTILRRMEKIDKILNYE